MLGVWSLPRELPTDPVGTMVSFWPAVRAGAAHNAPPNPADTTELNSAELSTELVLNWYDKTSSH